MAKTNDGKIIKELVEWNPAISEYDRVYPLTHTESIIDGKGNTLAELLTVTPGELKAQLIEVLQGAPEEYNTLLEIADALKNNKDSIGTIISGLSLKESTTNKNRPNGYLGLTADNKIPNSYLPEGGNIDLATKTSDGLMSSNDKSKLDDIELGANKTDIVDDINGLDGGNSKALSAAVGQILLNKITELETKVSELETTLDNKIVTVTEEQYKQLEEGQTVIIDGVNHIYNPKTLYVIPEVVS